MPGTLTGQQGAWGGKAPGHFDRRQAGHPERQETQAVHLETPEEAGGGCRMGQGSPCPGAGASSHDLHGRCREPRWGTWATVRARSDPEARLWEWTKARVTSERLWLLCVEVGCVLCHSMLQG